MQDFNAAGEQREFGEIIPADTIATLQATVRPGGAGEGGWLKRSKNGASAGLDIEFTVVDGSFAKRKFWRLYTMEGSTDGHKVAADISAAQLRGILESARGIRPDDESETARLARRIDSWGDFDGLRFIGKVGIEKGEDGYKDKNTLALAITPDRKQWQKVEQLTQRKSAAPAPASVTVQTATSGRPSWAQ